MTKTFVDQFLNIRRVSTPLVVVKTTDAATVVARITAASSDCPVFQWDAAAGFAARNAAGKLAMKEVCKGQPQVLNPADAMHMAMSCSASGSGSSITMTSESSSLGACASGVTSRTSVRLLAL